MKIEKMSRTTEARLTAQEYLKRPYTLLMIPDAETGTYTAQVLEFPGCVAEGETLGEAYERLEQAAISWVEAALDLGQEIPSPASEYEYGGKVALRLPKSLHRQAALTAQLDGTSLNQFIVSAVAEKLGASNAYRHLTERFERDIVRIQPGRGLPVSVAESRPDFGRTAGTKGRPSPK